MNILLLLLVFIATDSIEQLPPSRNVATRKCDVLIFFFIIILFFVIIILIIIIISSVVGVAVVPLFKHTIRIEYQAPR